MQAKQARAVRERNITGVKFFSLRHAFLLLIFFQACAPTRPYRPPLPPRSSSPIPPQVTSVPPTKPPETEPVWEEPRIKEEELKERRLAPPVELKDRPGRSMLGEEAPSQIPEDSSLIAKITPQTPPQRAVSLRLTEEGRKYLESGEYAKALARLERTIAIDSRNAYGYYYLAKTHYLMNRYQESLNFLDVAESLLSNEPYWLSEVFALKGEDFRALGQLQRADSSYSQALQLNSGNRVAAEGLSSLRGETQPYSR